MAKTIQTFSKRKLFESGKVFKLKNTNYYLKECPYPESHKKGIYICKDYGTRGPELVHAYLSSVDEEGFIAYTWFLGDWLKRRIPFDICYFESGI